MWATTRQNEPLGVSDQARHKPACTATEASQSLEILAIESRDIILSKQQTTKAQISLREQQRRWSDCADGQADLRLLLFAYDIRHKTHFLMARLMYIFLKSWNYMTISPIFKGMTMIHRIQIIIISVKVFKHH